MKLSIKILLVLLSVLVFLVAAGFAPPDVTPFRAILVYFNATVEGDVSVGDDLAVGDDATVAGDLAVTGDLSAGATEVSNLTSNGGVVSSDDATFGGFIISSSQSITPTDGGVITPTLGLVILTPASEVTPTITACGGGEHLILYNSANQTINLADTGNFVLTGALVLGQYDTLPLVCVGQKWVQVGPVSAN